MSSTTDPLGTWPDVPPRRPPEIPPPWWPEPDGPRRPVTYPPVPLVYDDAPSGADLTSRLLDRRIVLVGGFLDQPRATDAAARLMLLDGSGDTPVELVMGCPDGELVAALALADTIELAGVEVRARCTGSIGGPPLLPFAVASRRVAQPHAMFLMSEPRVELEGTASDIAERSAHHADMLATLHRRVAAATGQAIEVVAADFSRRRSLTAEQAQAYGLIDEVVQRR
jgi:ATP-dependent Clp protease, protease subunit